MPSWENDGDLGGQSLPSLGLLAGKSWTIHSKQRGEKCAVSFRNGMCFEETSWLKRWLVSGAEGGAQPL